VNMQEKIISLMKIHLERYLDDLNLDADPFELAVNYVGAAIEIERSTEDLIAVEVRDERPSRLIRFNPVAALGFMANLVAGVVVDLDPIVLACLVLSSLVSLDSLYDEISKAGGLVFWTIYQSPEHQGSRKEMQQKFAVNCDKYPEIEKEDFQTALSELTKLGTVNQTNDKLQIADKIVRIWHRD